MDRQQHSHAATHRDGHGALLVRVLVAALVVLSVFLPLTDHHLPERVPGHHHLIISQVMSAQLATHEHRFEHSHSHDPERTGSAAQQQAPALLAGASLLAASAAETPIGSSRTPVLDHGLAGPALYGAVFWSLPSAYNFRPTSTTIGPEPPPPVLPS